MKKKIIWVALTLLCTVFFVLPASGEKAYALSKLYIGNNTPVTLPTTDGEVTYGGNSGQIATGSAITAVPTGATWWLSKEGTNYTLTLNNANITAYTTSGNGMTDIKSINASGDLNLVVRGSNIIGGDTVLDTTSGYSSGIFVYGKLNISGDGILNVNSGRAGDGKSSYAIFAAGDLSVSDSVEIYAKGGDTMASGTFGMNSDNGYIRISGNAKVKAESGNNTGNYYSIGMSANDNKIIISGGTVIASTGTGKYIIAMKKPDLSSYPLYQWRTNPSDSFRINAYTYNASHTYLEIKPAVPVTDITMTNVSTVQEDTDLILSGTAAPATMADQAITWSIEEAGTTGATINGRTFRASAAGTARVRATIPNGQGTGSDYVKSFEITVTATPVITHTITATVGAGGSITPSGSVTVNDGASQSFTITPNTNYSISELRVDGVLQSNVTTYTFDHVTANHTIDVIFEQTFIPITDITMTSAATVQEDTDLTLSGTAVPGNATNQTITWSLVDSGTTGATVNGSTFQASAAGTARVKATIPNGLGTGSNYEKSFDITVTATPVITHTITATAGAGGSITPSGTVTVNDDVSQSFTITPNSNYSISELRVDVI
jgi:hypothetical protein